MSESMGEFEASQRDETVKFHHYEAHAFKGGYSGMTCDEMVEDAEGFGDSCGLGPDAPVHTAARQSGGIQPDLLGLDPLSNVKRATDLVRAADVAQYSREAIPAEQRGQIRVRLLNATPDPLGSIAALGKQYKGEVVRSLSEVTDDERRSYLDDFGKTVLNGPLEAAQFHFQIEGVTRSITHQMVRSRASFFAQESLRFAVPEGNWADEIPLPPWLTGDPEVGTPQWNARRAWYTAMETTQIHYQRMIDLGMPAEEARGVLPHDMPTRIHWVLDLRTLLTEAGKRTCTQAQFPWRVIFAGMAKALREYGNSVQGREVPLGLPSYGWQFAEIADRLRPVCFQTGSCGFMAAFDRSCSIRSRVDAFETHQIRPSEWGRDVPIQTPDDSYTLKAIKDWEWAADPGAARS